MRFGVAVQKSNRLQRSVPAAYPNMLITAPPFVRADLDRAIAGGARRYPKRYRFRSIDVLETPHQEGFLMPCRIRVRAR